MKIIVDTSICEQSSVARHLRRHDDALPGSTTSISGTVLDENCVPVEPEKAVFAIAYTDTDPNDGPGFKDGTDVLIAKLVDEDGSGDVSAGDVVITDSYPLDFAPSGFGSFGVTSHMVTRVDYIQTDLVQLRVPSGIIIFRYIPNESELYNESPNPVGRGTVILEDTFISGRANVIQVRVALGPSQPVDPSTQFFLIDTQGDQSFLDVDLNFPVPP